MPRSLSRQRIDGFLCIVLLSGLFLSPISCAAADGDITQSKLSNGLEIYIYEKHNVPVASIQVWYRTGPLNERPGTRGISHLFEHMMFRGSDHFGPQEHTRRIAEMGGWSNAFTDDDYTCYVQTVPNSGVDLVMEMEVDRMARLKLDENMFKSEREVVKEEYRLNYENDPYGKILLDLQKQLLGDHPYAWGAIGVMSDLDSLVVNDCLKYYRSRYAPNNAVLIAVGDIEPGDVLQMAERHFGPIPPSPDIDPDPQPPVQPSARAFQTKADVPVFVSGTAYWLPPAGHEDIVALEVLGRLLGWHLRDALVVQEKICVYGGDIDFWEKQASAWGYLGAHLPNVSADRVRAMIDKEIKDYLAHDLTHDDLDRARNQILLEETSNLYSVDGLAAGIGTALILGGNLDRFSKRLDQISALTPQDLIAIGNRYFVEKNRVSLLVEPEHSSKLLYLVGWFKSLFHL